jgi:phosphoglycolate phosphatase
MHCQALIADLDGTLLDTLADLAEAMNGVLRARGHPEHPLDAYRTFVGNGAARLVRRALPRAARADRDVAACLDAFRETYGRTWNKRTRPYAGIPELLAALAARGRPVAILTNKPQAFAERCVRAHFAPACIAHVRGQREGVPLKPDPRAALDLARQLGVPARACLFLGDSDVDMHTAVNAGMVAVGAAWGFRTERELETAGAVRIANEPGQVLEWL